jgi:hypothetical protein
MNLSDRTLLAAANRTRHRPTRSNVADVQSRVGRLQEALRDVTEAATLGAAVTRATTALTEDVT